MKVFLPFNEGSFTRARGAENENPVFRLPIAKHLFIHHNQDWSLMLMTMMVLVLKRMTMMMISLKRIMMIYNTPLSELRQLLR